jgi:HlyD family secretion protein
MDIARPDIARRKTRQRVLLAVVAVVLVSVLGYFVSRLEPAAPTVERAAIWMDTVKRGPMLRQVRGLGSLVPEEILMIPALVEGRVAQIVNLPGVVLRPDSIVVVLTNPELEVQAKQAEWALREAESQLDHLRVQLESEFLVNVPQIA